MDSSTERCVTCGRAVARVGRARTYVHANQFHQRFNHPAEVQRKPMGVMVGTRRDAHVIDLRDWEPVSA